MRPEDRTLPNQSEPVGGLARCFNYARASETRRKNQPLRRHAAKTIGPLPKLSARIVDDP